MGTSGRVLTVVAIVAALLAGTVPVNATSHGAITGMIHQGDDCVLAQDTHLAGEQRFVCELLPLTHAIARIDIRDGDGDGGGDDGGDVIDDLVDEVGDVKAEIDKQNNLLVPLAIENDGGCVANEVEAHASVHPWLPETYDYELYYEADGRTTNAPSFGPLATVIGTRSFTWQDVEFDDSLTVHASVKNKYAKGQELYNDGETRVSLPDDAASAELTFTCGQTSWRTNCAIDGELEEHDPPSRCQ